MSVLGPILEEFLESGLPRPLPVEPPNTGTGLDELLGPGRQTNPEIAMELAGTSDKRSAEYKAALRSVQRYRAGTRGRAAPRQALLDILKARARPEWQERRRQRAADIANAFRTKTNRIRRVGLNIILIGSISVAGYKARRKTVSVHVPGPDCRPVMDAAEAGDYETAGDILEAAMWNNYGIGETALIEETESIHIAEGR